MHAHAPDPCAAHQGADGGGDLEQDLPLDLASTANWVEGSSHVWDIVEEIVMLECEGGDSAGAGFNPFEVDLASLQAESKLDGGVQAAALAAFLREVLVARGGRVPAGVRSDLRALLRLHFKSLGALAAGELGLPDLAAVPQA